MSEVKRVTLDVGSSFNLTESTFTLHGAPAGTELVVGMGLAIHGSEGRRVTNAGGPWLLRWDDFGEHGALGTAAIMDPRHFAGFASDGLNDVILARVGSGETLRFLNGFGWTESGQFPEAVDWERCVTEAAKRWQSPPLVHVGPYDFNSPPLRRRPPHSGP